jgi:Na+/alanine symporter
MINGNVRRVLEDMHANEITAAVTLSVVGTSHQVDGVVSTVHHSLPVGGQKKKTGNGKYTPPDPPQLLHMLNEFVSSIVLIIALAHLVLKSYQSISNICLKLVPYLKIYIGLNI